MIHFPSTAVDLIRGKDQDIPYYSAAPLGEVQERSGGKTMKNLVACLLLLSLANVSIAEQVVEEWECAELVFPDWNKILVVAKVLEGRERGHIDVANITHEALYAVEGFMRRWDFGLAAGSEYDYAFVIGPDGKGKYYNFSNIDIGETTGPSMLMTCRQRK